MNAATATSDPTPTQVLILAKALLASPANWCQGDAGQDSSGAAALVDHTEAVAFCAFGAVWKAARTLVDPNTFHTQWARLEGKAGDYLRAVDMTIDQNDDPNTTFADVHAAFDKAIALSMESPHLQGRY